MAGSFQNTRLQLSSNQVLTGMLLRINALLLFDVDLVTSLAL
jgi:hypothetical protein